MIEPTFAIIDTNSQRPKSFVPSPLSIVGIRQIVIRPKKILLLPLTSPCPIRWSRSLVSKEPGLVADSPPGRSNDLISDNDRVDMDNRKRRRSGRSNFDLARRRSRQLLEGGVGIE